MDFDYGDSPFVSFGDDANDSASRVPPWVDQAAQEYRRIVNQVTQQARQSSMGDIRLQELFYMSAIFACKALMYFILQDAYEHGFSSANL